MSEEPIVVCLGYPALLADRYVDRVRAISPCIEVVGMPVDPDADWVTVPPDKPHEEPPAWAVGCADERREALARGVRGVGERKRCCLIGS